MKSKLLVLIAFFGLGIAFGQNNNPAYTVYSASTTEGGIMSFNVTLAAPCNVDTTIVFSITNSTTSGSDYNSIQYQVVFLSGQTSAQVSVPTVQDNVSEQTETFYFIGIMTSGCGASELLKNTAIGTIIDNDPLPTFTISSPTVTEGNYSFFAVALSNPSSTPTVISFSTVNGTASPNDYLLSTTTITIPAGLVSGNVTISTTNDSVIETNETFELCGTVTSGNTANTTSCGMCTITDGNNASISLSFTGIYNDYNNDGFTNVGDVIIYQYAVINTGQQVLSNIQMSYGPYPYTGGTLATLAIGAVDTTFTRNYALTQADINAGTVFTGANVTAVFNGQLVASDFGLLTELNISNGVKLNLFFDTDGSGFQNGQEENYNGGNFTYQTNNGVIHSVIAQNGMFTLYESNPAVTYNLGCALNANTNFCNGQYTLSTSSYSNVTVANGSGITTYNFPITTAPCTDLSVNLYQNGAPPRPGFTYTNRIQYTNNGNQTITNGTITFNRSSIVSTLNTFPATTTTATGFTYNFANLWAGETRYIDITMQVPTIPTVSIGQSVTNTVGVSFPPNESYFANNFSSLTQTIVGSYDPNDKTETHGGKILHSSFTSNDYLTYKIQFENTGTFEAVNIRVNDVLDAKLNPSTLRMVSASHPYILDRVGNTLNWKFEGVNLQPSIANTTTGKGYIVFQIKPTAGYAVNDIIPNTANIYFDFNPAIVTNTCNTQFVSTLANTDFDDHKMSVYPNPVQNNLTITNATTIDSVAIISVLGQEVINVKINDLHAEINTSELANGIYFVKITSEGKEKTVKIVKE